MSADGSRRRRSWTMGPLLGLLLAGCAAGPQADILLVNGRVYSFPGSDYDIFYGCTLR